MTFTLPARDAELLLEHLRQTHAAIREAVLSACEHQTMETLSATLAHEHGAGDTIFALDRVSEEVLITYFETLAKTCPCVLVAEGLASGSMGRIVLPRRSKEKDTQLTIIVDPIDGTRGLMYQKRPAWILTGVARNRHDGKAPTLADIELALQTEIPLVKQYLCDTLWLINGVVGGERYNRITGERSALVPRPSRATTIAQGYGGVARFFPGARDVLAAIDDAVIERLVGIPEPGCALAFEDQYISTGGQLYELMMGHDRWVADLRPLVDVRLRERGREMGLCCHPYDLCTESIARAAGVVVTDEHGERLSAPLDVTTNVAWLGFANETLREKVFPVLREVLAEHGLLNGGRKGGRKGRRKGRRKGGRKGGHKDGHKNAHNGEADGGEQDGREFVATLRANVDFFDQSADVVITRAPGRLDVMGGIADYSGSLVLQLPLAAATFAAAQLSDDRNITIRSRRAAELNADDSVVVPLDALFPAPRRAPIDYETALTLLTTNSRQRWAAYAAGAVIVLAREHHARITRGLRMLIASDVPPRKGVASSAALEVAAMQAICSLSDIHLDARDLAIACQRVENLIVGAPCGIMDQMTAVYGEEGRLLALKCQPAELVGQTRIPPEIEFWGIDSGFRHEVGGAEYSDVRVGAFIGYRIIADLARLPVSRVATGRVRIADDKWHGCLANVTPSEWERDYRDQLPSAIDGRSFLARYGGITDHATSVDPDRTYAVRLPTAHPIYENHRVRLFRALLESGATTQRDRRLLGDLMYQSHASYGACGLGSSGTDRLVELVRSAEADGLYGAKITGGGSGGVVAVLARAGSRAVVDRIARDYAAETGRAATVIGGSSAGAASFGVRTISLSSGA